MLLNDLKKGTKVLEIDSDLMQAVVLSRPNRFLVKARCGDEILDVHIHDPGRLKELIFPGSMVKIRKAGGLRTSFSITSCILDGEEILLDTRFHNKIAESFIEGGFQREVAHGDSRYDFSINNGYVEVKGCTMQYGNYVIFPEAPTVRGTKHIRNLTAMKKSGLDTNLIFLLFRKNTAFFYPNELTDPIFSSAFFDAVDANVKMVFPRFSMKGGKIFFEGMNQIGKKPF